MVDQIGLSFLSFDLKKGPVIPYCINLEDSFCEKMALRVLFTGVAGDKSKDDDSFYGESIIPFPDDDKIVFSYLFPIQGELRLKSEPKASAIALVFPQEQRKFLYGVAPEITKHLKQIADKIKFEMETSDSISKNTISDLNKLCAFDYLSNLKTLSPEELKRYVPEVNNESVPINSKETINSNGDIPEISSSAITLFTKSSETYKELVNTFGKKFFNILSIVDGRKSLLEISKESKIEINEVKNFLNILVEKKYVNILPDTVKMVLILEYFYNIITKTVKNNMGEMGINIIKKSIEELDDSYRFSLNYDAKNSFSFEKLKAATNSNDFSEEELLKNLSIPIIHTFQELENKNGRDYVERFKNNRFENIQENFGLEIVEKIKKYIL